MTTANTSRLMTLFMLFGSGLGPLQSSAFAQAGVRPPERTITLPCCRCLDGKTSKASLNTGSAAGSVPWRVSGPGVAAGATGQTINSALNGAWTATLPSAGWIQPGSSNGGATHQQGIYRYEVRIDVPDCMIPMNVVLSGRAAGDDEIKVFVDNFTTPIGSTPLVAFPGVSAGARGWGFKPQRMVSFTKTLGPGSHILRVEVENFSPGPHGLLVQAGITATCPTFGRTGTRNLDVSLDRGDLRAVDVTN